MFAWTSSSTPPAAAAPSGVNTPPPEQASVPVPPRRGAASANVENDIVGHLKLTMKKLEAALQDRQDQIEKLKATINNSNNSKSASVPSQSQFPVAVPGSVVPRETISPAIAKSLIDKLEDREHVALRKLLNLAESQEGSLLSDDDYLKLLKSIEEKLKKKIEEDDTKIDEFKKNISTLERQWQEQVSVQNDDVHALKEVAWRNWPLRNKLSKTNYAYDFFISYRVAFEFTLARELRLQLMARGHKVFLDQECLKDGEDWRKGFVSGLQRSRIVILLVSKGCIERMRRSRYDVDNVLLEWETAMAAAEMGFCNVVPVFIGTGSLNFSDYPKDRATLTSQDDSDMACQQSAFTTLNLVKQIQTRYELPYPTKGFPDELLDSFTAEVSSFNETYESKAIRRAHLIFSEMAPLETFTPSGKVNVVEAWYSEQLELGSITTKDFAKVKFLFEQNKTWNSFIIEENNDLDALMNAITLVLQKKPKKLIIKRKEEITSEFIAHLVEVVNGCDSIESAGFIGSDLPENTLEYLASLPSLKDLVLEDCRSPILKGKMEDMVHFFKERPQITSLNAKGTFGKKDINFIRIEDFDNGYFDRCAGQAMGILNAIQVLALERLDISETIFTAKETEALGNYLKSASNLNHLNLSRCLFEGIQDDVWKGVATAGSVRTLLINDLRPDEDSLRLIFAHLSTFPVENVELRFDRAFQTSSKAKWIQGLGELMSNSTTLKKFVFEPILADPECIVPVLEAVSNSKTITDLTLSKTLMDSERYRVLGRYLSGMEQLQSLTLRAIGLRDENEVEKLLKSIFSLKQLSALSLEDNRVGPKVVNWLLSGMKTHGSIKSLSLEGNPVGDAALIELLKDVVNVKSLTSLKLLGNMFTDKSFGAARNTMQSRADLTLTFDWSEDVNQVVKCDFLLPQLYALSNSTEPFAPRAAESAPVIVFSKAVIDAKIETVEEKDVQKLISATRESILKKSIDIPSKEKDVKYFGDINEAVNGLNSIFQKSATELTYGEFEATWPDDAGETGVVFLDTILPGDQTISDADKIIIRELQLRIRNQVLPPLMEWIGNGEDSDDDDDDDDDNNENQSGESPITSPVQNNGTLDKAEEAEEEEEEEEEEGEEENEQYEADGDDDGEQEHGDNTDDSASLNEVQGENGDGNTFDPTKLKASSCSYPSVKVLDTARNICNDILRREFPELIVIALSESVLKNVSKSEETFWTAINTWDYLMRMAEEDLVMVLPLFIASSNDGDYIIGKIITKLRHALYLLGAEYSKAQDTIKQNGKEKSLSRAFDVIGRLFKLQGLTIEKVQQCNPIVTKMVNVVRVHVKKMAKFNEAAESLEGYTRTVNYGADTGIFQIQEVPCIDDVVAKCVGPLLSMSFFKHFEGTLDIDAKVTNAEIMVADALKKSKAIETIYLDAYNVGLAKGPADKAITTIAKSMKKKNITKLILKWNITSGKASPILTKAVARQSTLKELELHGFSEFYMQDLCNSLLGNTTLESLTITGLHIDEKNHRAESNVSPTDAGVAALYNNFSDHQIREIARALSENFTLTELSVFDCQLSDSNLAVLLNGIAQNVTLRSIDLQANPNGEFALDSNTSIPIIIVLNSLPSNQYISSVELIGLCLHPQAKLTVSGVHIQDLIALNAIISCISSCASLKNLTLFTCEIEDDRGKEIIQALAEARRFEKVALDECKLGDESAQELSAWIGLNDKVLKSISATGNYFSPDSKDLLRSSLESNKSITEFEISDGEPEPDEVTHRLRANTILTSNAYDLEDWVWVIENGLDEVRKHLSEQPDFAEFVDTYTAPLFFLSCEYGDLDFIQRFIIPKNAVDEINQVFDDNGLLGLGLAIKGCQEGVIRCLHDAGVNPFAAVQTANENAINAFYAAAGTFGQVDMAKLVLELWPDLDPDEPVNDAVGEAFERTGFTVLHKAALHGYFHAVEYLLTILKTPNPLDDFGSTPLHSAARGELSDHDSHLKEKMLETRELEYVEEDMKNSIDHGAVIHILADSGNIDINALDKKSRTAFDVAVSKKQEGLAQILKELGGVSASEL
ncbi:hypothetical protein HDU97_000011 [Phlyctochytrium planicorne]|nr:hypothetical protein HDU97_000011 [Phlyctochytrium planicorne]